MVKIGVISIIVVVLVLIFVGVFLFQSPSETTSQLTDNSGDLGSSSANVEEETENQEELQEVEIIPLTVKEFDIVAKRWSFDLSTITVSEGD